MRGLTPRGVSWIVLLFVWVAGSTAGAQVALDDCSAAASIPLGVTAFDTTAATTDGPDPCAQLGSDVWFAFTAPLDSTYRFSLCNLTNYDAAMAIYDASVLCPPLVIDALGCDDDACGSAGPPIIELALSGGQTVRLQVGGFQAASGTGEIEVVDLGAPAGAELCSGAVVITTGVTPFDTTGSSTDGPPACAQIGSDHWFLFTAPTDDTWRFSLCATTNYDAAMAIYPASAPCPPTATDLIGCDDDACGGGGPPIVLLTLIAGETVRLQVGGWQAAAGVGEIFIEDVPPLPAGADILIGDLFSLNQLGREGSEIAASMASTTCNAGADPLDWFTNPNPNHPFITQATYRLSGGRLEQIGMSWAKHGFGAAQTNACSLGCTPFPNNTRLGSGCSDIYGASTNGLQSILGPRSEINPWTGVYDYTTSILSSPSPAFNGIERRMILNDSDLDATQWPGATYFGEIYVLAHDDQDHLNSVAWEPIGVTGTPGGVWSFDTGVAAHTQGPAIGAWPGATIVEALDSTGTDGRVYLGTQVTDLGGGQWRYDYAIHNLDLHGGIGQLTLPVPADVALTDLYFHAAEQQEFGYDDQPWSFDRIGDTATWQTDSAATATPQNPIRWGALYNFGFTADTPPIAALASLGVHEPGGDATLTAATEGPEAPISTDFDFRRGDANMDGALDISDAIAALTCLFACLPTCLDVQDSNDDGLWNIADPIYILAYLFQRAPAPPAPFGVCGPDPTADALDCTGISGCL